MSSTKWVNEYKQMREIEIGLQEMEREKFFILFNIFCHEVEKINPLLADVCLEIEEMMNETFYGSLQEYRSGFVDGAFIGLG
ncbi:asparaginase [Paenibacillus alvei]|uniref:hypothetical protein n=1 Tax=Paenibacillus alvei TaxID=44250 RepID=UPI0002892FD2|nr:hypothetical protein [Paenibacillus alvei]EJW20007.1 hypothetical protein PAV_1c10020 [Paenibacillus alvei DSM 29]MCY9543406.1 asparaginase [Paenibacillus alvei]MCY9704714.1 asparaginase [Paenibacillus alvei]MCY9733733.1 asparaginase [Paenibacillus alvei]MCY9755476.1 asparaginase [Paenibacillus alvei]